MSVALPNDLRELLDKHAYAVLSTVNPDGSPQSSVIWASYEGDEVVFSTILGRRKTRNMAREPRVSLCVYDRADPYRYVEVRGPVVMTEDGGPELIQRLARAYDGAAFTEGNPANVRVVCRISPTKVIVY
jgi:PPOX class probable F420-dependent enzyme